MWRVTMMMAIVGRWRISIGAVGMMERRCYSSILDALLRSIVLSVARLRNIFRRLQYLHESSGTFCFVRNTILPLHVKRLQQDTASYKKEAPG